MYHMFKMYLGDRNKCVANDQNISSLILEKEQYQIEIEIMTAQLVARRLHKYNGCHTGCL